ncbi:hypothetical protein ACRAKI_32930 [Saccharothrix isguenensis]
MRGRGVVPGVLLGAASSLVIEGVAAADDSVAAPVSLDAPVGIGAVALGIIGLVAGLVRRRRGVVVRAASEQLVVSGADPIEVRPATTGV